MQMDGGGRSQLSMRPTATATVGEPLLGFHCFFLTVQYRIPIVGVFDNFYAIPTRISSACSNFALFSSPFLFFSFLLLFFSFLFFSSDEMRNLLAVRLLAHLFYCITGQAYNNDVTFCNPRSVCAGPLVARLPFCPTTKFISSSSEKCSSFSLSLFSFVFLLCPF
jgi:hypothetical protein